MVSIPSQVFPGIPVIHAINKKWCTEKEVVFTFLLENDSDAFNLMAGLIPFLKATPPMVSIDVYSGSKDKACFISMGHCNWTSI
jgi:hypothetical protein